MSTQPYRNVAYGLSEPLLNVAQAPIIAQRDPTNKDRAQLGTEWINQISEDVFILVKVEDNISTWISIGAGTSANIFDADTGSAMPAGGIINLLGGGDVVTSAAGNTVTFTGSGADIFDTDSGTAIASSNTITIAGGSGITTAGSGSTVTITASGSAGITTVDGDTGSATGATIDLVTGFVSGPYANGTIQFNASGTTVTLNTVDGLQNVGIGPSVFQSVPGSSSVQNVALGQAAGLNIGNGGFASIGNCIIGFASGSSITDGDNNCIFGLAALNGVVDGDNNISIGAISGSALTGSESDNIYFNSPGVLGESNILRVGAATGSGAQNLAAAYICGIDGVDVGSVAKVITMASDQLGTATITAGSGISVTPAANTITIATTGSTGGAVTFHTNGADATASSNAITIAGGNNITTTGSGSTVTVNVSGTTNHTLQIGNGTTSLTSLAAATNGQIPIGSTGADPVIAAITAGTGISVTNGAGTITLAALGSVPLSFGTDSGTATPSANTITIAGGTGITTSGSGSTVTITASGSNNGAILATGSSGSATTFTQAGSVFWTSPFMGSGATAQADVQSIVPRSGTLQNLYVYSANNTSTTDVAVTVYVNSVATAITTTVTALTTGNFSDTTHTASVNAGDLVQFGAAASTVGSIFGQIAVVLI
jgi:hypothetical protein